jgi:hypothetical protein
MMSIDTPQGVRYKVVIALPATQKSMDMRIGLAGGAWTDTVLWENGAPVALDPDNPAPKLVGITEEGGQSVVELVFGRGPEHLDHRVVVESNGKIISPSGTNSSGVNVTCKYRCPKDKISKILFRTRPFEWQEMKGVQLLSK